MSYRINVEGEVRVEIRRTAAEQLSRAIAELNDDDLSSDEQIHQVRKRLKKTRAVLRLVRPAFKGSYADENASLRDAARLLAPHRDAHVLTATIAKLRDHAADEDERREIQQLAESAANQKVDQDAQDALRSTEQCLRAAVERVRGWSIEEQGFAALEAGFAKTYRRAKKAQSVAYRDLKPDAFHDWRKRVKHHRYHVQLLSQAWPTLLKARAKSLHQLSDLLGDDHDYQVLREFALSQFPSSESVPHALQVAARRSAKLRTQARPLGTKLFTEKTSSHSDRLRAIWAAARESVYLPA